MSFLTMVWLAVAVASDVSVSTFDKSDISELSELITMLAKLYSASWRSKVMPSTSLDALTMRELLIYARWWYQRQIYLF